MASNFRLDELIRRYPPREKKQKKAPKVEFQSTQLCWTCANACGGCSWSAKFQPVPGWNAEPVIIRNHLDRGPENFSAKSYKIYACPQFRADPRRAHDKACD